MPCYSYVVRPIDTKALDAFMLAKGLIPRSGKWAQVRARHMHKFRK